MTDPAIHSEPLASPPAPRDDPATDLLLKFLQDRDVTCPLCTYNLRNLTQPVCPECHEPLQLRVGVPRLMMRWLFVTLAPGSFSGVMLGIFLVMMVLKGLPQGAMPIELVITLVFLVISGATALFLAINHRHFLRFSTAAQLGIAAATWIVHIIAFIIFYTSM